MLPGHIILDVPRGDAHGRLPWISEDAHDAAAALVSAKYKLDADRRLKNQYPIRPETFVNYALPLANASVIDETSSLPSLLLAQRGANAGSLYP